MAGRKGRKQGIELQFAFLEIRVCLADFRRTRNRRRKGPEVLRGFLRRLKHLFPLGRACHLRLKLEHIGSDLLERLLHDLALALQVVHLVRLAEVEQRLRHPLVNAPLLLHLIADLGHGLVAAKPVLLVREALDRLRIGIRQIGGKLGRSRPNRNRDEP